MLVGYESARPDVQSLVPASARAILDLGCSNGALGAALKARQGATVLGVELGEEYAREAEARLDRVIVADAEAFAAGAAPPEAPFDCLIAADVLEHLRDPWAALRGVVAMLAPGATAVVSLPNVLFWAGLLRVVRTRRWPREAQGLFDAHPPALVRRGGCGRAALAGRAARRAGAPALLGRGRGAAAAGAARADAAAALPRAAADPHGRQVIDVTVSIVNHESRDAVLASLAALFGEEGRAARLQVIVVDNVSQDGSAAAIRAAYPEVEVVERAERAGYGANHNVALARAEGRHVLFLNDDARVRPGCIDALAAYLDAHPDVAVAAPTLVHPDGSSASVAVAGAERARRRARRAEAGARAAGGARAGASSRRSGGRWARRCSCGATPRARSAASTRATSCTPRRSTC